MKIYITISNCLNFKRQNSVKLSVLLNITFLKNCVSLFKHFYINMNSIFFYFFQGYRSCLTLVRIHPQPFISFHKAAFLGLRCSSTQDSGDFLSKFLDCMFFNEFINTRGPPWRKCDIFDELYSNIGELIAEEQADHSKVETEAGSFRS